MTDLSAFNLLQKTLLAIVILAKVRLTMQALPLVVSCLEAYHLQRKNKGHNSGVSTTKKALAISMIMQIDARMKPTGMATGSASSRNGVKMSSTMKFLMMSAGITTGDASRPPMAYRAVAGVVARVTS